MKSLQILSLTIMMAFFACENKQNQLQPGSLYTDTLFPELKSGEVFYKSKDPFGEIMELKGKYISEDTAVFTLSESVMLINGNFLVMKNLSDPPFRVFRLPDLKQVNIVGKRGIGPDEFNFPTLVPSQDSTILCYLYENSNNKLYKLNKDGKAEYCKYPFQGTDNKGMFAAEKQLVNTGINDFMYVDNSPSGKSIYRITQKGDSALVREVFNLGMDPKQKSPFAYIGDFGANPSKNRMVYAYKYFKIIKFMDLEAKTIRTINFEKDEFDESSSHEVNGLDKNITHYWGICAQDDYVYFLYSGRTPVEVVKEAQKQNYYIFVEQYDWNGNPVKKYKLDQWGYFTVDEKNKKLYLASMNIDGPFIEYQLP